MAYDPSVPKQPGDPAPTFRLDDIATGDLVTNPWQDGDGPVALAFFKVTCPVCQMAAPMVQALADAGVRVTAIGEDPAPALKTFAERNGQRVQTVSEPAPYRVSDAYGVRTVPTVFLVGQDGVILETAQGWDREGWNAIATAAGAAPISHEGDGLPVFRPG